MSGPILRVQRSLKVLDNKESKISANRRASVLNNLVEPDSALVSLRL